MKDIHIQNIQNIKICLQKLYKNIQTISFDFQNNYKNINYNLKLQKKKYHELIIYNDLLKLLYLNFPFSDNIILPPIFSPLINNPFPRITIFSS